MARQQLGAAPSGATDAATKGYVDSEISTIELTPERPARRGKHSTAPRYRHSPLTQRRTTSRTDRTGGQFNEF